MKQKILIIFGSMFCIGYILNFIWEKLHVALYTGYEEFAASIFMPLAIHTAFIDVFLVFVIYAGVAILEKNIWWVEKITIRQLITAGIFGFITAAFIEFHGLSLNKWAYAPSMPLIPYLNVGLSPILQMIILPIINFRLTHLIVKISTSYKLPPTS